MVKLSRGSSSADMMKNELEFSENIFGLVKKKSKNTDYVFK